MEFNKKINGNCWVAYFDILGFRKLITNFPVWYVLDVLKQALNMGIRFNIKCKFVFFSDSFIFYTDNDSKESFSCIEATSTLFFHGMFLGREKIPMRGCLSVGQFYADKDNGIFFGPALIEAHKCAEDQNWLGFVLSDEVEKRLDSIEFIDVKSNYKIRFTKWEVPFKKVPKQRNLLAYNHNLLTTIGNTGQARGQQYKLWEALDFMKGVAQMLSTKKENLSAEIEKSSDYEEIITKYDNTERFMFYVYPELKETIKNVVQANA